MIGVTMGDANGVGPEILLRAFCEKKLNYDFVVIGDYPVLDLCRKKLKLDVLLNRMTEWDDFKKGFLNIFDLGLLESSDISVGEISKKTGFAALKYVKTGTHMTLDKKLDALVTLPVNKEAIRMSEPGFSGHTGYIAGLCKTKKYTMMLVAEQLIVSHVSTHVSQWEAIANVKKERILDVIRLTSEALQKINRKTRIAVAGLNPHAGENNAFGIEETREILPAIERARNEGINATGPHPADTIFYQAVKGNYDAVVCMYHDQGHIPVKLLAFDSAVNVTLGLPVVRTSVDHGTAFDIAWKGIASTASFINAFHLSEKLIENIPD